MLWQLSNVLPRSSQASHWIPLTEVGTTLCHANFLPLMSNYYDHHSFRYLAVSMAISTITSRKLFLLR